MPTAENGPDLHSLLTAYRYGEVGRCVNSVTHDVNNALGVILAYAELIGMESSLDGEARDMLKDIVEATRSASAQLTALTGMARPAPAKPGIHAPADLLEHVVSLRRFEAKRAGITIGVDVAPDVTAINVEGPRVERALLYLLVNALEAAGERGGGEVQCAVSVSDGCVQFSIDDGGPEIDGAIAAQMFEPFFTTKAKPHLGLGLPAVKRIADAIGGAIMYAPGAGFRLTVPLG